MLQFKSSDILFTVNQRRPCDLRRYSLNLFLSVCTLRILRSRYISSLGWVYISDLQRWCRPISWLSPVLQKACQLSVLQEPHESLTTHIKQSDSHREHVGCSVNLLVAAWMHRLHCFPSSHQQRACEAFRLAEEWFHIKNPQIARGGYMGQTWYVFFDI